MDRIEGPYGNENFTPFSKLNVRLQLVEIYRHLARCETVILGYVRIQAALSSLGQCPQMVQTQPPR